MVKHIQTIRRLLPTNCLSVFDHFVGLALKGLISFKTSSRLFLVEAKDHLETVYGLSIYIRFQLHTYYHSIHCKKSGAEIFWKGIVSA